MMQLIQRLADWVRDLHSTQPTMCLLYLDTDRLLLVISEYIDAIAKHNWKKVRWCCLKVTHYKNSRYVQSLRRITCVYIHE